MHDITIKDKNMKIKTVYIITVGESELVQIQIIIYVLQEICVYTHINGYTNISI